MEDQRVGLSDAGTNSPAPASHAAPRGTAPPQPTPLRRGSAASSAGAARVSPERHGPQQPAKQLYGLPRLRDLLKLSAEVPLDELAESACAEIEVLKQSLHEALNPSYNAVSLNRYYH